MPPRNPADRPATEPRTDRVARMVWKAIETKLDPDAGTVRFDEHDWQSLLIEEERDEYRAIAARIEAEAAQGAAPLIYLPIDCPVCGRRRVEWDGKVLRCEKCTTSSEWDGFSKERYQGAVPALQATGEPPCDLLGPHEHNGVSSTGPCWRNPMYAGER